MEKQYEKILNHVRLSNSPNEREYQDGYYGHKMNTLAEKGKVVNYLYLKKKIF